MKTLHIIPSLGPLRGGPSLSVVEIVKELSAIGIVSEIATTNDNGTEKLNVETKELIQYRQVPVRFFDRFSPKNKILREFSFSMSFTTWLWKNIDNYDVIHVHAIFSYTCTIAMLMARMRQIPYIVRPNGLLCKWSLRQSYLRKRLYLFLVERANLNKSYKIEFTSNLEQSEASTLSLEAKSFVLPYGISMPIRISNARQKLREVLKCFQDEVIILFMSRLHQKKGLDYLIPALGDLQQKNFRFVLAGSGSSEYELEISNMIKEAGIEENTISLGFVEGEMKELLLQGSDIFVLTSHSESFGLAVLEAIAGGLAIVTTPGVPLSNVVEDNDLGCVTEMNVKTISDDLNSMLLSLDDKRCVDLRKDRARHIILSQYSWSSIAKNLSDIYQSLLRTRSTQ